MDPMGRAIAEYWKTMVSTNRPKTADKLRVFSPIFEEDEIPLTTLFRSYEDMPEIERKALDMAKGRILDVGAASGCHSLVLQERGMDVTAIDISPLSVETMKERGVKKVLEQDFFTLEGQYDTIRMQYKDTIGEPFNWLYIDADTLMQKAGRCRYAAEVVAEGEHYDYLARITKKE